MDGVLNDAPVSKNLLGLAQHIAVDDRENRVTEKDFEDRREAGYLTIHVPMEPGGRRLTLVEVCKQRGRPVHHASAVPFEVNMHLHWATDRWGAGDRSLESTT
jgi:hypothetical protein